MFLFCLVFAMSLCASVYMCFVAGKGLTSWLSLVVSNCEFVTFSIGILGRVWYLIVSIPDLCTLTYFHFRWIYVCVLVRLIFTIQSSKINVTLKNMA